MTRWLIAAVVWAGAVAAAIGLGVVADNHADKDKTQASSTPAPPSSSSSHTSTTVTLDPSTGSTEVPDPDADVTQGLPPAPSATASPHGSLFDAANLEIVLKRMQRRFGGDANIAQFGLYPGEADFVVVYDGGTAEVVRAGLDVPLDVSAKTSFSDDVQTISLSQIQPQKLAAIIVKVRRAGDLPTDGIARIALQADAYSHSRAGFRVYPVSGTKVYRTLITGGLLETTSG